MSTHGPGRRAAFSTSAPGRCRDAGAKARHTWPRTTWRPRRLCCARVQRCRRHRPPHIGGTARRRRAIRPGSAACAHPCQLRRPFGCPHAFDRDDCRWAWNRRAWNRWAWNPAQWLDEEAFRPQQPIAESLVRGSRRPVRIVVRDHDGHGENRPRMLPHDRIGLLGGNVMDDPFLAAVLARILALGIAHQPQWPDTAGLIRKGAAFVGAEPVYEHLDRRIHLTLCCRHTRSVALAIHARQHASIASSP